jgi:hypothetical protein
MSDVDKVSIERLGVSNYNTWAPRMTFLLKHKSLWGVVANALPTTASVTDKEKDERALALIGLYVHDYHLNTVYSCTSAKAAWDALEEIYKAKSTARRLQLKRELNTLKMQSGEPLTKYFSRAKDLQAQLQTAGYQTQDEEVALSVLAGLPSEYDIVTTVIQTTEDTLDLDDLLSKLLNIEQRVGKPIDTSDKAYFGGGKPGFKPFIMKPAAFSGAARKECWYCGKPGHIKSECRKKAYDERHGALRHSGASSSRGSGARGTAFNGNRGPIAPSGARKPESFALSAVSTSQVPAHRWVLDSGASYHLTPHAEDFINLHPINEYITITFGNGGSAKAEGMGDVMLDNGYGGPIKLNNVLYVPDATASLLSIPRSTEKGASFQFTRTLCEIVAPDGRIVAKANRGADNLFYMEAAQPKVLLSKTSETPELWHRRYGHLGYDNLTKLVDKDMVTGITVTTEEFKVSKTNTCEPCILAKHHRAPFPSSETHNTTLLQLVHMDVCGPMQTTSLGGSRYLATFLDDASKFSAVRPIARKSDVPAVVREVLQMLETQTDKRVRSMLS